MFNYQNVGFINKLPDDFSVKEVSLDELKEIKDSIDMRLKKLENKLRINNFMTNIINKEQKPEFIKTGVFFSPKSGLI